MGDTREFESLTLPLLGALYRLAVALTGREHDARDLVQSAYVKALERFETFRPGSDCKAWMMRILRNTWIDQLRHRKVAGTQVELNEAMLPPREQADRPAEDPGQTTAGGLLERFSDEQIIQALAELPESRRLALFLSDVEGLSQEEIAEVLDVAVGTVKSRVSRARAVLKARLRAHARDLGFPERES